MVIQLPKVISDYFAADKDSSGGAIAECFTETAVVKDEGNTYTGREAIRRWKTEATTKYTYTVEPFSIVTEGDRIRVASHVVGDFPGSPVDLRYFFILEGDKIAGLEITL
ncbi:nuclear transport factor 2 family protein [Oceanibaculum nanhaiense]|uniref:nuclear transport factor 2 family protein n=1 Tax=Oceanibaculum nanhaiense TaxID=1909734 RepID=UPI003D2E494F